jgi:hypothetical protein
LPGNLDASEGGHNTSHIMLKVMLVIVSFSLHGFDNQGAKIPKPLTKPEVQHVSRHAHGLYHGRDHADLRGVSPLMRSSPGSVSSFSADTVLYANESGRAIGQDHVHLEVCNSCSEVRVSGMFPRVTTSDKTHSP